MRRAVVGRNLHFSTKPPMKASATFVLKRGGRFHRWRILKRSCCFAFRSSQVAFVVSTRWPWAQSLLLFRVPGKRLIHSSARGSNQWRQIPFASPPCLSTLRKMSLGTSVSGICTFKLPEPLPNISCRRRRERRHLSTLGRRNTCRHSAV